MTDHILSYLSCMLRFENETNDTALERFYEYYDYRVDYGKWEDLATLIEEHAHNGMSLTPRMLSELMSIKVNLAGLDPLAVNVYHDKILSDRVRKIAKTAGQRLLAVSSGKLEESIEQILADVDIANEQRGTSMDLPTHSAVGMKMFRERADDLASGRPRVSFPWSMLNDAIPFIYDDDLILLSGMSKTGKSSAAHQMALYNASKIHVLYFHNEDNPLKIFLRRIAQYQLARDPNPLMHGGPEEIGTLNYRTLLSTDIKTDELMAQVERENAFVLRHIGNRLTYVYCPGWTAEQITSEWRKQKRQGTVDLVIIDYLNKIETYSKAKTLGTMAGGMEYNVELFKREAGRKGSMTPCVVVQQENEDGTVRDTRSSYIKSQVHISFSRDMESDGMQLTGRLKILRANDGMTGNWEARFYPPYMIWIA